METWEKEKILYRIQCRKSKIQIDNSTIFVFDPTPDILYEALDVYEYYLLSSQDELLSSEELYEVLMDRKIWSKQQEKEIQEIPKEIEELKFKLYKSVTKSNDQIKIRRELNSKREKLSSLCQIRNSLNYISCDGYASIIKNKFIINSCLYDQHNNRLTDDFFSSDAALLDKCMIKLSSLNISEAAIRDIARTEPWRSIWNNRKNENGLYGIPSSQYSEYQNSLVSWSSLYDNIFSHPQCPLDEVINDDDMLDGWMIEQRRLNKAEQMEKSTQNLGPSSMPDAQEVYLVAQTSKDANKIYDFNEESSRKLIERREKFIKKNEGKEVDEFEIPDTKKRIKMEIAQHIGKNLNGK